MVNKLPEKDREALSSRYEERYRQYGYDPRTLDWDKGKQLMRFSILTSQFDLRDKEILDIGCGFGDLNKVLLAQTGGAYKYLGIDVVQSLVSEARGRYGNDKVRFFSISQEYIADVLAVFYHFRKPALFFVNFPFQIIQTAVCHMKAVFVKNTEIREGG